MYKVGDFIIYGNNGVCKIENIGKINIPSIDQNKSYYTLKPLSENGKIFVPVDTNVFMRKLITYEEAKELIELIPSIKEMEYKEKNPRLLQEHYKSILNTHECRSILSVIASIYDKKVNVINNGKKLSQTDEKFMKMAKNLINDEFSIVLGIPRVEIEKYIKDLMENKSE